jgi:hypothetical protein
MRNAPKEGLPEETHDISKKIDDIIQSLEQTKTRISRGMNKKSDQHAKLAEYGNRLSIKAGSGTSLSQKLSGNPDHLPPKKTSDGTGTSASIREDEIQKSKVSQSPSQNIDKTDILYNGMLGLEKLPVRYHVVIKKYFDAISRN